MVFVPKTRPAYPQQLRREAVELLRAGGTPRELSETLAFRSRRCATGAARTSAIATSVTTA
jgi:hypothetical protein